jgi:hypothetical protein
MLNRCAIALALCLTGTAAQAFDDATYPDLRGQWLRARPPAGVTGQGPFDPTKSGGRAQQAPLTEEYQKLFEASLADQAAGGQGGWQGGYCLPVGMPGMMTIFRPMEIIVLPETTYIRIDHIRDSNRRIYTDGRDWPQEPPLGYDGYSIGKWIDTDGDGKFDALEAETRHLKGPRVFDPTGLPLHADNRTIIKERFYSDKTNRHILYNEITVTDNALTRPWSAKKQYRRDPNPRPVWEEMVCTENNLHVRIGSEDYMVSADGLLMPAKKDQPPPDLRYFTRTRE